MSPKFSVVISLYNKAAYIESTLKSVLNQTFKDFEIIVVDDGSTDNSLAIAKEIEYDNIHIITQKNQGVSKARNIGINAANGLFIALLDADDYWLPNYLETVNKAIQLFPDMQLFSTAVAHKINSKVIPFSYDLGLSDTFTIVDFFEVNSKQPPLFTSAVVFKKDIITKTGLFNPTIISGQDTDLWIRFGLHYKIVFINDVLVHYNYDGNSLSNQTFDMSKKPTFAEYKEYEKKRPVVKKYIDRNRYAMALMSKIHDDNKAFLFYKKDIDLKNLSSRKRLLLSFPKWLLLLLLKLKSTSGKKIHYKPL